MVVDLCLGDERGINRFLAIMRQIAADQHMTFIDNSARTRRELDTVGQSELGSKRGGPTINVGIEGNGGLGVTAGNLGLSRYQVALGFTNGSNVAEGQRFSDTVVQILGKEWTVRKVPDGKGAKPLKGCA